MKDGTITIHKHDCPNIHTLDKARKVPVNWNVPDKLIHNINVYIEDKLGMVEEILNTLLKFKINVLSINLKPHKRSIVISLKIKANKEKVVEKTIDILKKIRHVNHVAEEKEL